QLAAAAARAGRRRGPLVAAMVAAQAALALVQGEPGVAAGAGADPGAGMAEQGRREAAAIEKGQYLPALVQVLAHAGQQRFRQPAVERLAADVEDLGARHLRAAGPLWQPEVAVAAPLDVIERLQRRRGGAEHHRDAEPAAAGDGQVAG